MKSIYSPETIEANPLYAPLMVDLNCLYKNMNEPTHIKVGMDEFSEQGKQKPDYWIFNEVGAWNGIEHLVAEYANHMLQDVYSGLNLKGNGGISCAHTTDQWKMFTKLAIELVEDYHVNRAYHVLNSLNSMIQFNLMTELDTVA